MTTSQAGKEVSVARDAVRSVDGAGRPRITFTMFRSSDDPALQSWLRFRAPLSGGASADDALRRGDTGRMGEAEAAKGQRGGSGAPGFWRLLASNNRELGRSFLLYRSFDHARSHVQLVQSGALEVVYVTGPHSGARGWVVTHEGAPVITCSRWYDSVSARASAASGALAALPLAHVADVPDRSGPSGRFLRRVPMEQDAAIW